MHPSPKAQSTHSTYTQPVPHDQLVKAIKAFLVIEPGIDPTAENVEVFDLINEYFNPALRLPASQVNYLYQKLNQRIRGAAVATLAEEYAYDLGIAPFLKYDHFSPAQWYDAASPEQVELFEKVFIVVKRSKLFTELWDRSCSMPLKPFQYIASAMAEKGIQPSVAADRIYAVTHGSRVHAEACGLV